MYYKHTPSGRKGGAWRRNKKIKIKTKTKTKKGGALQRNWSVSSRAPNVRSISSRSTKSSHILILSELTGRKGGASVETGGSQMSVNESTGQATY
jgi:hypothetical protein